MSEPRATAVVPGTGPTGLYQNAPPNTATEVRERVAALRARVDRPPVDHERIIETLCHAAHAVLDGQHATTHELRRGLLATTGLSPAMIEWGLTTSFSTVQPALLRQVLNSASSGPHCLPIAHELVVVVLSGNLFTASLRALFLPLLSGCRVIAKAAADSGVLARGLKHVLDQVDPEVAARLEIVQFARQDAAATSALLEHASAVAAYGDDNTIHTLRAQCAPTTHFIAHGHGLAAAYITREQLHCQEAAREAAQRLALDVAAYDQRGCLSAHFALVESGAAVDPRAFAYLLAHEALPLLAELLPRGQLTTQEQAAELQWRAVAAVRGELHAAKSHAVSFEPGHSPRPSPAGRSISVYPIQSPADLSQALNPFARHLKCLGVSGTHAARWGVARTLGTAYSARVCRSGEMQTPPFNAFTDGRHPLEGLFQCIEVR